MNITHFLYNSFIISDENLCIAIDPGAELYHFRFNSIIPEPFWNSITHIFVTHGDPDHHWYTDKVELVSHAPIICGRGMVKKVSEKSFMLGPRSRGLRFDYSPLSLYSLSEWETIHIDRLSVTGIPVLHGPLTFKFGLWRKTFCPGPTERIGYGAIGFKITLSNKTLIILGDTLCLKEQWVDIHEPDILIIPIGGDSFGNTMGIADAIEVIRMMRPRIVIPCHYNIPSFFQQNKNLIDTSDFVRKTQEYGSECRILMSGESTVY